MMPLADTALLFLDTNEVYFGALILFAICVYCFHTIIDYDTYFIIWLPSN